MPQAIQRIQIPVPAGKEICNKCGGDGHQGFEEESGLPYSCFACGTTGYVAEGSQREELLVGALAQAERFIAGFEDDELQQVGDLLRDVRAALAAAGVEQPAPRVRRASREPDVCQCCGEDMAPGQQFCCTDEFPEPGDVREWS